MRTFLISKPILSLIYGKCMHYTSVVNKETRITIEGFQRSANTFAVVAFESAQEKPIKVAHHLHDPVNVILSVKMKIPTLVLIREPKDAVISLYIFHSSRISVRHILRRYISFYSALLPYKEDFIVGTFEECINDFGKLIKKVNKKFKTNFNEFKHTRRNVGMIFNDMLKGHMQRDKKVVENVVTIPRKARNIMKENLLGNFHDRDVAKLLQKANELYEVLSDISKDSI